jgi:hypothetical protein
MVFFLNTASRAPDLAMVPSSLAKSMEPVFPFFLKYAILFKTTLVRTQLSSFLFRFVIVSDCNAEYLLISESDYSLTLLITNSVLKSKHKTTSKSCGACITIKLSNMLESVTPWIMLTGILRSRMWTSRFFSSISPGIMTCIK